VSRGLSNAQRGAIVRTSAPNLPKIPQAASECAICRGLFLETDKFADLAIKASEGYEFSNFLVGTKIDAETVEREESFWVEVEAKETESIKAEMNREIGKILERRLEKPVEFTSPDMVFLVDTRFDRVALDVAPLFVYGRYRKFSREIPQTRWPCRECRGKGCPRCGGKGKMYETSVQDLIGSVLIRHSEGVEDFFHGMGREDIDARMLGNGRPFVAEVRRPRKRSIDLRAVEKEINEGAGGLIEVEGLRMSKRAEMQGIKESKCAKTYRVKVRFLADFDHGKLNELATSLAGKPIRQRTPNRVSHRRANLERQRIVRRLEVESVEAREAVFVVETDSGTYIKELMHGDEGRTEPSVAGLLGVPCEVIELDVIGIGDKQA